MANPQAENGHIDIANEIAEVLTRFRLSGEEYQVLWVIWRKTYGWHKKEDCISLSQFFLLTNMKKPSIIRALKKLIAKNVISKTANAIAYSYRFIKDYSTWKPLAKKLTKSEKSILKMETVNSEIKKRDENKCCLCDSTENLVVHHIDYNQTNWNKNNLITLCHSCHGKTNFNHNFWINAFSNNANVSKRANGVSVSKRANGVSKRANKSLAKELPTKENYTKETITKETTMQPAVADPINNQINIIIKKFEGINPFIKQMYGNKTQRQACIDLIKEKGFDDIVLAVEYAIKVFGKPYAPQITTPYELKIKYAKLLNNKNK